MTARVPQPFVTALADLTQWLEAAAVPAMIIGGIAASILGRPRATRDIDALAVAPLDQWTKLLRSSKRHGILPRIENPLEFAHRTRVLLLRHTESGIDIDVILSGLAFEVEAVSRATVHDLNGVPVRLPQVEDLLIMKAIAHRPQDLRDIEGLLDVFPTANVESVLRWVRDFSAAAELPDLPEEFERLLTQREARPPSASVSGKISGKSNHGKKKKKSKR